MKIQNVCDAVHTNFAKIWTLHIRPDVWQYSFVCMARLYSYVHTVLPKHSFTLTSKALVSDVS